jgi:hypothetical protein
MQCALLVMCKLAERDLNIDGSQLRELQEKARAGRGFDGAVHLAVLATLRYGAHGVYTAQCDASALHRPQAKAAFILAKDAERTRSR